MAKLLMAPKVLMVALQDEEREEEPLHLVAPDMGGTTERGPLDKAPAPATLEAASVEEDEVEEDDVDGGGEDQDGEAVDDAEGLDDDLEDVCLDCFDTRNDFEPDLMTLLASCIFARSKQFVYPVLGVGVLAQPPGEVVEGVVEAAGVVALRRSAGPSAGLSVAPVLVLLQEEEGEEEQLCGAGGAGHGGHHREGPTAGGEE